MEDQTTLIAQYVPVVAGVVAAVRKHVTSIDGIARVAALTLVVALLVVYQTKIVEFVPPEIVLAIKVTIAAVGGVSILSYFTDKMKQKPPELPETELKTDLPAVK